MRIAVAIVFLIVAVVAAVFFYIRRNPLAIFIKTTRSSLTKGGLEKVTIDSPKGRLIYWRGGSGPPLVLVHGGNDQAGTWSLVAPELAESNRLVVPDLPGHGESGPESGPILMADLVAGLDLVIRKEFATEPVTLAGNSMGGWVAMLYALEHPERVSALVLEDSSGIAGEVTVSLFPKDRIEAAKLMGAVLGPDTPVPAGYVLDDLVRSAPKSPGMRLSPTDVMSHLLDGRLAELQMPVTVLWGDSDGVLPPAYGRRLSEGIPGSTFTLIERCGHIPHRECSIRFRSALKESLAHVSR